MKLTKFGTLVNKTTYLFTSIRDRNISRECANILEIQRGGEGAKLWGPILENSEGRSGHIANPFCGGGMDIFWNHKIGRRDVDLHRQLWVVQVQMG